MQIFLDSLREPTTIKFDKVIRSFRDFVKTVDKENITFMSLDYELDSISNALDILWYLKENEINIPFINIHARNNEAREQIRKTIKKHFKNTFVTFIKNI
jgi:hypothetical protein